MQQRSFKQVDVFTEVPYLGNPVAVVVDAGGLSEDDMRRFARWTNLSETTFLLPPTLPGADYRVRIFTPGGEIPFAGHPTLGSCHAWLEAGHPPKAPDVVVQECAVGLVSLRRSGARLAFAAPPLKRSAPQPELLSEVRAALGLDAEHVLDAQLLDNGPQWLGLLIDSPERVLKLTPDLARLSALDAMVGLASVYADAPEGGPHLEVRAFAPSHNIPEDPVTGSLNASLAQWLIASGRLPPRYTAAQGACLHRAGRVYLEQDAQGQAWVGGHAVTCISGNVQL